MNIPVTVTEGLTIVTLVMAIISMALSSLALWPQWKDSLAVIRDVVLWMALVIFLVAVATLGWKRYATTPPAPRPVTYDDRSLDQLSADDRP